MTFAINTNMAALSAQRNLSNTSTSLTTPGRLSTGLRVGQPAPPPPYIPNPREVAQHEAERNAQDAAAYANVTEGALSQTTSVLTRMREVTVTALNDVLTDEERNALNEEFSKLKVEAVRFASGAQYNGEKLLEVASNASTDVTFGTSRFEKREVALLGGDDPDDGILTRSYEGLSFTSDAFNLSATSSDEQLLDVMKALDSMTSDISTAMFAVGTFAREVRESASHPSANDDPGTYTPTSPRVPDRNFAAESRINMDQIRAQAAASILAQANQQPQMVRDLLRG